MSHHPHSSQFTSTKENSKNVILVEPSQESSKKSKNSNLPKFYNEAKYKDAFSNLLQLSQPSRPKFKPWNNVACRSPIDEDGHPNQMQHGLYKMSNLKGQVHMSAGRSGIGQSVLGKENTYHQKEVIPDAANSSRTKKQDLVEKSSSVGPVHMSARRAGKDIHQFGSSPKQNTSMSEQKSLSILKELMEHCHVQQQEWRERQIHYMKMCEEFGPHPVKIDLDRPWDPNAIA